MRHFPFKILFISILLPPICYMLTLQVLEGYFQKREYARLNNLMVRDYEALYEGRYTIKEEINRNLGDYLAQSLLFNLGVRTQILVKTGGDRILYPSQFKNSLNKLDQDADFSEVPVKSLNFVEVAAENFRVLNGGLSLFVDVKIRHNSWLSNSILVFYVFLSVLILRRFIKRGIRETERQEKEQKGLIQDLSHKLARGESKLKEVVSKEEGYLQKIKDLREDKKELSKDIDGFLDEMETLETGLKTHKEIKEEMELEVLELREEFDRLKERTHKPKKKTKKIDTANRRFRVLYKNLTFTERAVEGFLSLTGEFQLKAEEIIHKLNDDDSQVSVKRKVFGKGGKMNILEVDFSYSGRIYYQKDSRAKTKIVAIGTKNTQEKDLAFIESVA